MWGLGRCRGRVRGADLLCLTPLGLDTAIHPHIYREGLTTRHFNCFPGPGYHPSSPNPSQCLAMPSYSSTTSRIVKQTPKLMKSPTPLPN